MVLRCRWGKCGFSFASSQGWESQQQDTEDQLYLLGKSRFSLCLSFPVNCVSQAFEVQEEDERESWGKEKENDGREGNKGGEKIRMWGEEDQGRGRLK